ncbi:hypothetical protein [Citrobacter phage CVT22]|uniref:Uncharacterized protein n=1 Tax=Citrobacter phage CVT22 TaxID=1622234 RepID=A0A0R6CKT2_9CAUD|nr:hypothetical protein APL39_gp51 [Citrobacter phage CVT22]AJT60755.1 hypothetical protein [Citrobacter phage CVT22]
MIGDLKDAPEWATHYVENVYEGFYWFINFDNYRWTCFNRPKEEYLDYDAEHFVTEDVEGNSSLLVVELNINLENE